MKLMYLKPVGRKLSIRESLYWKKVFMHNVMIGTEIEFESGTGCSSSDVRNKFGSCGSSIKRFKDNGISEIKGDGSLRSGAEICTSGKKVYGFMEQFSLYKGIIDKLYQFKPLANARAGWHNHVVLQNFDGFVANEMPVPGIILANTFAILKLFYPAFAWISSSNSGECYTRRNNFCLTDKLQRQSVNKSARDLYNAFENRYSAINTTHLGLDGDDISNFHLEFRFPDVGLFPALMATQNILFKAVLIKAVEISKFGVLTTTEDNLELINKLYSFRNKGFGSYNDVLDECYFIDEELSRKIKKESPDRESLPLNEEGITGLKKLANELVNFLAPTIKQIDETALTMLKHFANTPVSLMFKEMKTDKIEKINDSLEEIIDNIYVKTNDEEMLTVLELIESGMLHNVESTGDWFNKASNLITCKEGLDTIIDRISKVVELGFSKELGYYVK